MESFPLKTESFENGHLKTLCFRVDRRQRKLLKTVLDQFFSIEITIEIRDFDTPDIKTPIVFSDAVWTGECDPKTLEWTQFWLVFN